MMLPPSEIQPRWAATLKQRLLVTGMLTGSAGYVSISLSEPSRGDRTIDGLGAVISGYVSTGLLIEKSGNLGGKLNY